ncbi:sodium/hydrogen exchanger 9B2-like isoform X2 [Periplaneta americana]|uniref:sodium/hydrogen exchanger 9B2-like isoform X2 n=1 Tax=Periplaneta americana TaxID=6978 RepID=UPI0037E8A34A
MNESTKDEPKKSGPIAVVDINGSVPENGYEPKSPDQQNHDGAKEQSSIWHRIVCCGGQYAKAWEAVASHPRWPAVSRALALSLLGLMLWGNAFSMAGGVAGPEGQLFRIGFLCVLAYLAGWIVHFTTLPPLLGMLLVGIALRNIGFIALTGPYVRVSSILRKMALVVILIRAGVGLDPAALKRLGGMVLRLTVIPALMEAVVVAVMSHYLLDMPWMWGFLLGAVLAAVSPAVVVPCLFQLQDKGYGRKKGIPTLLIAAATLNDIISISAFGVLLSIIFSTGDLTMQILNGPIGVILGFVCGGMCGMVLHFVPQRYDLHVVALRTVLLAAGGLLILIGSEAVGFDGAGPLGCIVAAFVASHGWRAQGWNQEKNPVEINFVILWKMFQPVLFALIGTEIDLFVLDPTVVGLGMASVLGSLAIRILVSVVVVSGENLNWKEKIFISFAWFPKATVQAAIGPVALDTARRFSSLEGEHYGHNVLMIAVLSILLTAPIGAILITMLGPRLLHRDEKDATERQPMQDS